MVVRLKHLSGLDACVPGLGRQLELAVSYADRDPHASLNKSRSILEKLLRAMHETELGAVPNKATLAELVGKPQLTSKVPSRIRHRMDGIQRFGNMGSHLGDVEASDAERALADLAVIIEWYLSYCRGEDGAEAAEIVDVQKSDVRGRNLPFDPPPPMSVVDVAGIRADNPRETLRLLEELERRHGLTLEHFRALHHLGERASVRAHETYCRKTRRFTGTTNATVALRLEHCLRLLREGHSWADAITSAQRRFPFSR